MESINVLGTYIHNISSPLALFQSPFIYFASFGDHDTIDREIMQEKTSKSNRPKFKTLPNTPYATNTKACPLLLGLLFLSKLCLVLCLCSLQLSLTGGLGLDTLSIHSLLLVPLACLLSLGSVDLCRNQYL
jgi:hypothetical protein